MNIEQQIQRTGNLVRRIPLFGNLGQQIIMGVGKALYSPLTSNELQQDDDLHWTAGLAQTATTAPKGITVDVTDCKPDLPNVEGWAALHLVDAEVRLDREKLRADHPKT